MLTTKDHDEADSLFDQLCDEGYLDELFNGWNELEQGDNVLSRFIARLTMFGELFTAYD